MESSLEKDLEPSLVDMMVFELELNLEQQMEVDSVQRSELMMVFDLEVYLVEVMVFGLEAYLVDMMVLH